MILELSDKQSHNQDNPEKNTAGTSPDRVNRPNYHALLYCFHVLDFIKL